MSDGQRQEREEAELLRDEVARLRALNARLRHENMQLLEHTGESDAPSETPEPQEASQRQEDEEAGRLLRELCDMDVVARVRKFNGQYVAWDQKSYEGRGPTPAAALCALRDAIGGDDE